MLAVLSACAGSSTSTAPGPAVTAPTATSGAPAANPQTPTNAVNSGATDQLAQGKLIFEKTAGGVGCASCHALDGKGNGPAGLNAPNIRGKTEGGRAGSYVRRCAHDDQHHQAQR
jgi:mono/diheme cytochrome c family protein